jgi:molybdenum cofactor guanylyltransferase
VTSRHLDNALFEGIKGLVLAGGHSTRFGSDKAAVKLHQQSQLNFLTSLLGELLADVFVSIRSDQGGDPLRANYPQIHDIYEGLGPSGGLLAAHSFDPECAWLIVACDMPLLSADMMFELLSMRSPRFGATAYANIKGEAEPLCAIYEPATLASFSHLVNSELGIGPGSSIDFNKTKDLRVSGPKSLLRDVDTKLIDMTSRSRLQSFNTPDELAVIRAHKDFDQS